MAVQSNVNTIPSILLEEEDGISEAVGAVVLTEVVVLIALKERPQNMTMSDIIFCCDKTFLRISLENNALNRMMEL
jgi:hypothetical protein